MKTLQRERTPLYVSDAKNCARHLVRESLDQILAGTFEIPSFEEMISILERDFEHTFDEFMARRKIMKSHISWSREQVDEYLGASGRGAVREGDLRLLRRYARRNDASYCRPACGACATSCPRGVPISELLRARMYAVDYRDLDLARGTYRSLGAGASACLSCAAPSCLGACPHGLDIPRLAAATSRLPESA